MEHKIYILHLIYLGLINSCSNEASNFRCVMNLNSEDDDAARAVMGELDSYDEPYINCLYEDIIKKEETPCYRKSHSGDDWYFSTWG